MADLYIKVGVDLIGHPKTLSLGGEGFALYVASIGYSQKHLLDGFVPSEVINTLVPASWFATPNARKSARKSAPNRVVRTHKLLTLQQSCDQLIDTGLWVRSDGGFQITNYLKWQRSRSEVEKIREQTRQRVQTHRSRNAVTNAPGNAQVTPTETKT
jgi:hypothetical protein